MTEPTLSLGINKQICDAEGCSATATEEIKISVGKMGAIELYVCSNCKTRFVAAEECITLRTNDQSVATLRTNPRQDSDLNE